MERGYIFYVCAIRFCELLAELAVNLELVSLYKEIKI